MYRYVALMLVLCAVTIASAAEQAVNQDSGFFQLSDCKAYADPKIRIFTQGQGYCGGQLRALAYVSEVLAPQFRSCIPNGVPNGQLAMVVIRYIEARPERMHEDFLALALQAYQKAWPCK